MFKLSTNNGEKIKKSLRLRFEKIGLKITIYAIFTQKRYNFVSALASEVGIV